MGGPERPPPSLGVIEEVNTLGLKVNSAPDAAFYTFSQYREGLVGVGFTQVTLHGDRPLSARKGR